MRIDLNVPKVNANDEFVKVVTWYYGNKDLIKKGSLIADFETSKSIFEFEAEHDGYLYKGAAEDDTVAIGQLIGFIFSTAEEINEEELKALFEQNKTAAAQTSLTTNPEYTRLSNDAKAFVAQNNIDVAGLNLKGLITRKHLLSGTAPHTSVARNEPTEHTAGLRSEALPASKYFEIEQLSIGQRDNLTSSLTVQLNTENLFRNVHHKHLANSRLPVILSELAGLLKEYPRFCSFYHNGQVYYYDEVNIGVALDLDNQLKVPVIQNADKLSVEELMNKVDYFINCYLDNRFSHKDLTAGSFTVTDLSGENILSFQPLINGSQSAILGIGMDANLPGKPMTLTMVFDHKVLSGMDAANFLNQLKFQLMKYAAEDTETSVAAEGEEIVCCKCFTELKDLYTYYQSEAVMFVHINGEGKKDYICHICSEGY